MLPCRQHVYLRRGAPSGLRCCVSWGGVLDGRCREAGDDGDRAAEPAPAPEAAPPGQAAPAAPAAQEPDLAPQPGPSPLASPAVAPSVASVAPSVAVSTAAPSEGPAGEEGDVLAVGYQRIVYGDHGAYIEFSREQVNWKAWPHYHNKRHYWESYFDEFYTAQSHKLWYEKWRRWEAWPTDGLLMLYAQRHSVADKPWAPGTNHQRRDLGYADYRPGYFYLAADRELITVKIPEQTGWFASGWLSDSSSSSSDND